MSSRSLADFTKKKKTEEELITPSRAQVASIDKTSHKIGVTLRLFAEDWERLHYLSIQERTKIQQLLLEGLNAVLEKRGLPKVKQ